MKRAAISLTLLMLAGLASAEDLSERIDAWEKLRATGQESAAQDILRDTLTEAEANPEKFHDDPANLHQLARAALRLERIPAAVGYNTRALELEPRNSRFLSMRGYLMLRMERPLEAIAAYESALENGATEPHLQYELGVAHLMLDRPEDAIPYLQQALVATPDDVMAHIQIARAMDASGDRAGALAHFEKAYELDPSLSSAAFNAGVAAHLLGDFPRARRAFLHVIENDPKDIIALGKLVQLGEAEGNAAERDKWRERLFELYRSGESSTLNNQKFFTRDQFAAGGKFVLAFEYFDYTRSGITDVKFSFHVLPDPKGESEYYLTFGRNEKTTEFSRSLGTIKSDEHMHIVEGFRDGGHFTYHMSPEELSYAAIKEMIIEILNGTRTPISSTTTN